jgi:hypothetical protein
LITYWKKKTGAAGGHTLPSMDDKLKQVVLRLVEEIYDLRANLIVLSGHEALHTSVDNAQAAKDSAIEKLRPDYEQFRKEIESLF